MSVVKKYYITNTHEVNIPLTLIAKNAGTSEKNTVHNRNMTTELKCKKVLILKC